MESHPLRMRGLKQKKMWIRFILMGVASFTDAWIETKKVQAILDAEKRSHPLRMRGLKLNEAVVPA